MLTLTTMLTQNLMWMRWKTNLLCDVGYSKDNNFAVFSDLVGDFFAILRC